MDVGDLEKKYLEALTTGDYPLISEIVSHLNNEKSEFKKLASNLYLKIEQDLFDRNVSLPNVNFNKYSKSFEEIKGKRNKLGARSKKEKLKMIKTKSFSEYFISFYNRNKLIFASLKDYYLLKLSNKEIASPPKILILCDPTNANSPLIKELERKEKEKKLLSCSKEDIANSLKQFQESNPLGENFICILNLTPNLNESPEIKAEIENLFGFFEEKMILTINKRESDITIDDYLEEEINEDRIEGIIDNTRKVFNHKVLSYDQQRIIKSFFPSMTATIDYRILDKGASGASVIEVQAIPFYAGNMKRYVIKLSEKKRDSVRKLKSEIENFNRYVKHHSTIQTIYAAEYKTNENFEAIQYNYASMGSSGDAFSFADILKKFLSPEGQNTSEILVVCKRLLDCELIAKSWNQPNLKKIKCGELYNNYFKKEKEIFEAIYEIGHEEVDSKAIISFFGKIKTYEIDVNVKVCHGDLHTDNFFYDNGVVTLIDFGFTGEHHAVIDHALFEASIRFKHFPRYIPVDEYLKFELNFLDIKSFQPNFDLSFIKRDKLRELYNLIYEIRKDSSKYFLNKKSALEYMISLFLISFRQIPYRDLNQLYILRFVNLLSKNIQLN